MGYMNINYQYIAMIGGSLMAIAVGMNAGWPSPYLPYLLSANSHIATTEDEGFWCAVAALLGAPLGSSIASITIDLIGRKNLIVSMAPICCLANLMIAASTDIWTLSVARLVIGAVEGALYMTLAMYYGEIASPAIRGFIGSSTSVAALFGTILVNVIGPFISISAMGIFCATLPILGALIFYQMPDSPYFSTMRGDLNAARANLRTLRGHKDVDAELDQIHAVILHQETAAKGKYTDLFTIARHRRALAIYAILAFANKFSGKSPVTFYTAIIFESTASEDGGLDPVVSTITFYVVGMIATIGAMCVVDRYGRRPLMLLSSLGCAIALATCSIFLSLQAFAPPSWIQSIRWLPIVSLLAYNLIFSFGLSFGPSLYLAELFPTSVKAKALFLGDTFSVLLATTSSKYFQESSAYLGMQMPFWTFAVCTLLATGLIYSHVPETKGKTLEQIQIELDK